MDHLISLHSATRLVEANTEIHRVNHLLVCETNEEASTLLKQYLTLNNSCGVAGETCDNIAKISINNFELMSGCQSELEQAQRLKSLLKIIEESSNNQNKRVPQLAEGIYYYNSNLKKVLFYRFLNQIKQQGSHHLKNINNIQGTQILGIFAYLLCYSSNIKQYICRWRQAALKKQDLNPIPHTHTKIGQFIASLLNKELPTLKIAMHSLQITIERILWAANNSNCSLKQPGNQQKIQKEMKICLKNQSPRRLKQSNSMTNLSSSANKARKYKKVSPGFKNEKAFKQNYVKTSVSFWNGKMSNTFTNTTKTNALLGNTKNLSTQWQKENAILDSFAKINEFNLEKSVINQSELLQLLEKKQKTRKLNGYDNKENKQEQKIDNLSTLNRLQIKFVQKQKKQMKFDLRNLDICIQPEKKLRNFKLNSTIYSVNERLCEIPKEQKIIAQMKQSRKEIQKNEVSSKKIKEKPEQEKENEKVISPQITAQVTGYISNTLFLYETIQILCNQKVLRRFWLVSLYSMYLFYYRAIFVASASVPEAQTNHKTNLVSIASRIEQYKSNPEFNKQMDTKSIEDIDSLLFESKNLDNQQKNGKQEVCLRVLKKQFEKNKSEIIKNKGELIKNNRFKCFLIYMIRLAICISVVTAAKENNCGVNDFSRYERIIMDESKHDNQIDLLSELRNCEQLF